MLFIADFRYKWAVTLDSESAVPEFDTQIVNLAYEFPFTLDPFQKQVRGSF